MGWVFFNTFFFKLGKKSDVNKSFMLFKDSPNKFGIVNAFFLAFVQEFFPIGFWIKVVHILLWDEVKEVDRRKQQKWFEK